MATKRRTIKKIARRTKETPVILSSEHQAKLEREKKLAMWAGVVFFMVVIITVWVINFKNNVRAISKEAVNSNAELGDIAADFKDIIAETRKNMDELGNVIKNQEQVAGEKQAPAEMEQRIELEKLLFSLNDKLAEATSTSENK
ncbi:hypothetical protein COU00_00810 [Candidatus Falkowbacteria bacterium CG10_big_fil_rev_8_21_14_0_10_43_11]|uniref:Uncharacterized protein n=1 Tax=Candidatus Falkowbacteria bacterium CG10_big_fil_rev_8_21_14_0_10_43_11 TaxID=1974568 RepID=A0A2M6WMS3_9BACT|nr:MAG: hypothetical protein COU00_00810 [Candidatus Falkowbacteria bacterium CG10_big_fil_rev_8_21_14_0_10_43_11]